MPNFNTTTRTFTLADAGGHYDYAVENISDYDLATWDETVILATANQQLGWAIEDLESMFDDVDEIHQTTLDEAKQELRDELPNLVREISEAVEDAKEAVGNAKLIVAVEAVVTASEADQILGKASGTTAQACRRGAYVSARQSGSTWLIARREIQPTPPTKPNEDDLLEAYDDFAKIVRTTSATGATEFRSSEGLEFVAWFEDEIEIPTPENDLITYTVSEDSQFESSGAIYKFNMILRDSE